MPEVDHGEYDIVLAGTGMQGSAPGDLARIFAEGHRVATQAFVGVDWQRSLLSIAAGGMAGLFGSLATRRARALTDALQQVAGAFADTELGAIAEVAAPDAEVVIRPSFPGLTTIMIRSRPSQLKT